MFNEIRSGFNAAQHTIDVVSNNMANASTTGFKRSEAMFEDLYASDLMASDVDRGMASRVVENKRSHVQGSMIQTDGTLDMAVSGRGMFMLGALPGSEDLAYTRDGSFSLTKDGDVIAFDGRALLDVNKEPIKVPMQDSEGRILAGLEIDYTGKVLVAYGSGSQSPIAQVGLAAFDNPGALKAGGQGQFFETAEASMVSNVGWQDRSAGFGRIESGFLEGSNADITEELILLMTAQQAFSAQSRLMQAESDITKKFLT
ncbi:MAG: flagellar hook basal-body protein [Paracoccaceae bacterium]|nr:flagellar hook basal-body protein [Paracoccaceae bacterium]